MPSSAQFSWIDLNLGLSLSGFSDNAALFDTWLGQGGGNVLAKFGHIQHEKVDAGVIRSTIAVGQRQITLRGLPNFPQIGRGWFQVGFRKFGKASAEAKAEAEQKTASKLGQKCPHVFGTIIFQARFGDEYINAL